jgi:hypothetical protein
VRGKAIGYKNNGRVTEGIRHDSLLKVIPSNPDYGYRSGPKLETTGHRALGARIYRLYICARCLRGAGRLLGIGGLLLLHHAAVVSAVRRSVTHRGCHMVAPHLCLCRHLRAQKSNRQRDGYDATHKKHRHYIHTSAESQGTTCMKRPISRTITVLPILISQIGFSLADYDSPRLRIYELLIESQDTVFIIMIIRR